jgi:arylamine N-acetyltransferase
VRSVVRINDASFAAKPYIHQSLIVMISDQYYLIDPGFGYSSLYGALRFDCLKTSEAILENGDRYKVEVYQNCYRLSSWMGERWFSLYDFDRPIVSATKQEALDDYCALIRDPHAPIARNCLKPGVLEPTGRRVGFYISIKDGTWDASVSFFSQGKVKKQPLHDPRVVREAIDKHLRLKLPEQLQNLLVNNHNMVQAAARSRKFSIALTLAGIGFLGAILLSKNDEQARQRP